jgi:hypothetical protein
MYTEQSTSNVVAVQCRRERRQERIGCVGSTGSACGQVLLLHETGMHFLSRETTESRIFPGPWSGLIFPGTVEMDGYAPILASYNVVVARYICHCSQSLRDVTADGAYPTYTGRARGRAGSAGSLVLARRPLAP